MWHIQIKILKKKPWFIQAYSINKIEIGGDEGGSRDGKGKGFKIESLLGCTWHVFKINTF